MVFALLTAAIIWNLGTWYLGLPSSSSHTMVGSIIGVGVANQLINAGSGTSGVDWSQAAGVGKTLLFRHCWFWRRRAAAHNYKAAVKEQKLYDAPKGNRTAAYGDPRAADGSRVPGLVLPTARMTARRAWA